MKHISGNYSQTVLDFELIQAFKADLVICKYNDAQIKTERATLFTSTSPLYVYGNTLLSTIISSQQDGNSFMSPQTCISLRARTVNPADINITYNINPLSFCCKSCKSQTYHFYIRFYTALFMCVHKSRENGLSGRWYQKVFIAISISVFARYQRWRQSYEIFQTLGSTDLSLSCLILLIQLHSYRYIRKRLIYICKTIRGGDCRSSSSNTSETTGQLEIQFPLKRPWVEETVASQMFMVA